MEQWDDFPELEEIRRLAGMGELPAEEDEPLQGLSDMMELEPDGQSQEEFTQEAPVGTLPDPENSGRKSLPELKSAKPRRQQKKPMGKGKKEIALLSVILCLLVGMICLVLCLKFYVIAGGRLYPRGKAELDLRDRSISGEVCDKLTEALPDTKLLWNVPFQGKLLSSNLTELTVTELSAEDAQTLLYFRELKVLNAENCTDYDNLLSFRLRNPDCRVRYRVTVGGSTYDSDAKMLVVSEFTEADVEKIAYLPDLEIVDGTNCPDAGNLAALQAAYPGLSVRYTVTLGDSELRADTVEATVSGAESVQLIQGLAGLPNLKTLTLVDPAADGSTLEALRVQYPQLTLSWYFRVNGKEVGEDAREVDVSGMDFPSLTAAENMASCFPKLEKFIMSNCTVGGKTIDNDDMADFRERMRSSYKVVWTVQCGRLSVRTDDTTFMPTREHEYYFLDSMAGNLKYCEDMICIDIGHHKVKDISFVRYMPHLKYLILTDTAVQDISPVAELKELIFLELTFGIVRDYTPLLQCTALEDLNMDKLDYYADPTPIYQMTWLKTLFWHRCNTQVQQKLAEALPNTHLDFTGTTTNSVHTGWRNLQNYYDMRDLLGMPYMN